MSGFSPEWLALREPVDHAARNKALLAEVSQSYAGQNIIRIVDLGCGAGSNLRGTYANLPERQHWTLVDHDPALLKAARSRLIAWADKTREQGEEILLHKGEKELTVDFRQADLTRDLDKVLDWQPDLVTASALFDLVSEPWIKTFVAAMAKRKLPLYTVLTYDGREEWQPAHGSDAAILQAFNAHQKTDKGFGPAAGPNATAVMMAAFKAKGYITRTGESPWLVTANDRALGQQLTAGIAAAVRETGRVPEDRINRWLSAKAMAGRGMVGHLDLWARPKA